MGKICCAISMHKIVLLKFSSGHRLPVVQITLQTDPSENILGIVGPVASICLESASNAVGSWQFWAKIIITYLDKSLLLILIK